MVLGFHQQMQNDAAFEKNFGVFVQRSSFATLSELPASLFCNDMDLSCQVIKWGHGKLHSCMTGVKDIHASIGPLFQVTRHRAEGMAGIIAIGQTRQILHSVTRRIFAVTSLMPSAHADRLNSCNRDWICGVKPCLRACLRQRQCVKSTIIISTSQHDRNDQPHHGGTERTEPRIQFTDNQFRLETTLGLGDS